MTLQKLSHIFTKIAFKPLRTNLFHIVFLAIFLTLGTSKIYSQELPKKNIAITPEKQADTSKIATPAVEPLSNVVPDTTAIVIDTLKPKKSTLEGIVKRKAVDYEKVDQKNKLLTLYNEAELYYQDVELKSGIIVMDYAKNEVYAGRIKDSTGAYVQRPVFKQGSNVVEPDSIRFNFKTK